MRVGSIFKKMLLIPVMMVVIILAFGLGFVHEERLDGPYFLIAIDIEGDMALYYQTEDSQWVGRIGSTVFAVGWDQDYFVAKRHPNEDKTRTEYYYLIKALDRPLADPEDSVRGPFTRIDFEKEKEKLKLPDFSRELADLK